VLYLAPPDITVKSISIIGREDTSSFISTFTSKNTMDKNERIEKAVTGALQLFTELGLTVSETKAVAHGIDRQASLYGDEAKLDAATIQNILQRQEQVHD